MELDKERDVLKQELEKTTASGPAPEESSSPTKKVGIGIRTYAADIAGIMKKEKGSVIKIALAEQERRQTYKENRDPTNIKNMIVMILGFLFIAAGIFVFVYTIIQRSAPVPVVVAPVAVPSLFYTENQTQTDITTITRGNLFSAIHKALEAGFAENDTMTTIALIAGSGAGKSPISAQAFFSKLGIKVPERAQNTLTGQFMLGVYKQENKGNLFLVLKTKDFNESFSAMKEWEVSMVNDMVRLFKIDPLLFSGDIFLKEFESGVAFNKEARTVFDENGQLVLSYVYLDRTTIAITNYMPAVEEIIKRINSQSIK